MNPLVIGGGVLVALLAYAASHASTTASQEHMIFVDYAWITSLPTYVGAGGDQANPAAKQLPPPPGVSAPGRWVPYPGGWWVQGQDAGQSATFRVWANVPQGVTVWMWMPSIGTDSRGVQNVTKINGYWVSFAPWHASLTPQDAVAHGGQGSFDPGGGVGAVHVSPLHPWFTIGAGGSAPPPPAGSTSAGSWRMKHPGYLVWLEPHAANEADATALIAQWAGPGQPAVALPWTQGSPAPSQAQLEQSGLGWPVVPPVSPPAPSAAPVAVTP